MLIVIALSSGFLLLLPVVQNASASGISPTEAVQCMNREKGVVIDVSTKEEFAASHIKTSLSVPLEEIEARLQAVAKNKKIGRAHV